jgi:hypothetical protein
MKQFNTVWYVLKKNVKKKSETTTPLESWSQHKVEKVWKNLPLIKKVPMF